MKTEIIPHETEVTPALIQQSLQPVYGEARLFQGLPETTDILLHGQLVHVTEVCPDESYDDSFPYTVTRFGRFFRYTTDYGYTGYIQDGGERVQTARYLSEFQTPKDIGYADAERYENIWGQYAGIGEKYLEAYREVEEKGLGNIYNPHASLATVWAGAADLFPVQDITDTVSGRMTLYRGAKLLVAEDQSGVKEGWTRVYPASTMFYGEGDFLEEEALGADAFFGEGEEEAEKEQEQEPEGAWYIRSSALKAPFRLVDVTYDADTRMENCSVYGRVRPQEEEAFRRNVTETAKLYLGAQYRWAGKTISGIDCSGLCSMAYMLNGVYIFRDARIEEGYPVRELVSAEEWKDHRAEALSRMKPGDLLYYKGHIAMYLGEERYIHATGRAGSDGVVINSLNPSAPDYRQDLDEGLLAVGSIFVPLQPLSLRKEI